MSLRLLVVNNILTPYNVSFFAAVSEQPDVVARTVLLAPTDSNRMWQVDRGDLRFDYRVLPSLHGYVNRIELPLYLHWGLWSEMHRFRPDVIAICGYHYVATLEVLAFARAHAARAVLWSGSHLLSGFIKRGWADAYKRWIITRFDSYLTYGTASREQLIHHGAPADRIVVGCNTVDVHWFKEQAEALEHPVRPAPATRLLFVGRLVPLKNVSALISAVGRLQQQGVRLALTIVGDGPARASLEAHTRSEGVRDVAFTGFLGGKPLVQAYVSADALILPSTNELWGLVINEAAACGIPSVVSTLCGAAQDLIQEGVTGLTFDPTVPGALEEALTRIAADPDGRRRMGEAAQRFILSRDQTYAAARLVQAARLALGAPRNRGANAA